MSLIKKGLKVGDTFEIDGRIYLVDEVHENGNYDAHAIGFVGDVEEAAEAPVVPEGEDAGEETKGDATQETLTLDKETAKKTAKRKPN